MLLLLLLLLCTHKIVKLAHFASKFVKYVKKKQSMCLYFQLQLSVYIWEVEQRNCKYFCAGYITEGSRTILG